MSEKDGIIFVRNTHPNETSAFSLARTVAETFKQTGYNVLLKTLPYQYSLNYLVDHEADTVLKYCGFISKTEHKYCLSPEFEDEFRLNFEDELRKSDYSGAFFEFWKCNLIGQMSPAIRQIRNENKGKPIVEFHNKPALKNDTFSEILSNAINPISNGIRRFFRLPNDYYGYIAETRGIEDCYFLEVPAIFRIVPREVLERRKRIFEAIQRSFEYPDYPLTYLQNVVDFKKSKEMGLTGEEAVREIAKAIKDVIKKS